MGIDIQIRILYGRSELFSSDIHRIPPMFQNRNCRVIMGCCTRREQHCIRHNFRISEENHSSAHKSKKTHVRHRNRLRTSSHASFFSLLNVSMTRALSIVTHTNYRCQEMVHLNPTPTRYHPYQTMTRGPLSR